MLCENASERMRERHREYQNASHEDVIPAWAAERGSCTVRTPQREWDNNTENMRMPMRMSSLPGQQKEARAL
jgi:hypothetical protein